MAPDRGLVEPDLVIFLSGSPEVLSKRASYGEEIF
jgi:thymidylate kinase